MMVSELSGCGSPMTDGRHTMSTTKRSSKKNRADRETGQETGPKASRPHMPGYGVPKDNKGLLPWSHLTKRMAEAQNYWICTVSPDGRPHATPVWGLWLDDRLYFGGEIGRASCRERV